MTIEALAVTAAVGAFVGLVSGLLGIGGGVFVVPFLYLLFASPQWSGVEPTADQLAVMAHATSLAIILPTALAGIRAHRRSGGLAVRPLLPLGLGAAGFSVVGAFTAARLPSTVLQGAFGILLLLVGLRLLGVLGRRSESRPAEEDPGASQPWSRSGLVAAGGAVGYLSALLGIGGGVVAIPLLMWGAKVPVERVAGSSLVVVLFAAVGGVSAYGLLGHGGGPQVSGAWGHVFLPAAMAMLPGAVFCAPLGARLNRRMNAGTLRRLFGLLLLALGIRLLWTTLASGVG